MKFWGAWGPRRPSPETVAQQAARAQQAEAAAAARARAERERASQAGVNAQRVAEAAARREEAERRRELNEAFCAQVKAMRCWFPGDRVLSREPPRGWLGRIWEIFR